MRRALFLARAEVLHIVRDRATLAQVLIFPLVQLLVLSNAATFSIKDTPTYVVDFDRTSISRRLIDEFDASGHFRIVDRSASMSLADEALLRGTVTMVLTVPRDFEVSLMRGGRAQIQLAVNAEKGSTAGIVQFYASRIVSVFEVDIDREIHRTRGVAASSADEISPQRGVPIIDTRVRNWYNPALNYRDYMVPGILVALVTLIGTLLTAQNIAREKELGTLEQLNVTPMTRGQFIAGKLLPFWVLALIELGIGLVIGRVAFDIPIRGSLLLLFAAAGLYLIVALAIGLWISTLVDTQQQAMFVTFFVMNVYLLMSGLFTPIESMSRWVQPLSMLNPVRHFVTISRAVLVKGAGPAEIAEPLLFLAAFATIMLTLAVRQYAKRTA